HHLRLAGGRRARLRGSGAGRGPRAHARRVRRVGRGLFRRRARRRGGGWSMNGRGRKRSLEVTGGPAQAAARPMLRAMGWPREARALPQAGVAASWNKVPPCNMHLDALAVAAGEELRSLDVLPLLFHTISVSDGIAMGTEGMRASLPSRDWIADSVELV